MSKLDFNLNQTPYTHIDDGAIRIKINGKIKLWLIKRWVKHPKLVFEKET